MVPLKMDSLYDCVASKSDMHGISYISYLRHAYPLLIDGGIMLCHVSHPWPIPTHGNLFMKDIINFVERIIRNVYDPIVRYGVTNKNSTVRYSLETGFLPNDHI